MSTLPRRDFLKTGAATLAGSHLLFGASESSWAATPVVEKLPVTALITAYYPVSHADVIVTKILEGYAHDGGMGPGLKLESIYVEQAHPHDISQDLAKKHGVRLCKSIDEAITLGTDRVQVAGVMSIAEHGDYPFTPDTQQKMYPRRRFFDETVATFRRCGQSVPYFNDKHLSYRWEDAIFMVETAREMKFPMLAGSSLPLTWRFPAVELPRDCEIESVLSIGYGPLEDYGFHALETHQCMIERRKGGETGVTSVRAAIGADIRATEAAGEWSSELFAAARQVTPGMPNDTAAWKPTEVEYENYRYQPAAYLFEHRDGLKSAVIMAAGLAGGFSFAVKLKGQEKPIASWFKLQDWGPFGHFAYLVHAFEQTMRAGRAVYPVERTLLTTGILDRCMHSMAQGGSRLATPELAIKYQAADWTYANHPQAPFHLSDQ
ncbi:MAG: hypothetical protein O2931_15005 [Planctomycetota bacterium]|nr:hypothetical protein [Planctomycetota bacterium]MDA1180091.1 hypothetical protein [Planctomycetota bacterium]